jgi:hypothetical protein
VNGGAHQRGLDHRAALERPSEAVPLEVVESRPEPDVHRRRVLRLDPAETLQCPRQRLAAARQEELTLEERPVQLALREDSLAADQGCSSTLTAPSSFFWNIS